MGYAFDSEEARRLNKEIFETIYYGALLESCALAEKHGAYETFQGSPSSKGILQYDMWNVTPTTRWNWVDLKMKIKKHGSVSYTHLDVYKRQLELCRIIT